MGKCRCFSVVPSFEVIFRGVRRTNRMMIDRREFIAGATLVYIAPAMRLLPSQQPSAGVDRSRVVFMIRGWSVQDDPARSDQVWVTVSNSWRTAWR
jgi:hypothetical protein